MQAGERGAGAGRRLLGVPECDMHGFVVISPPEFSGRPGELEQAGSSAS